MKKYKRTGVENVHGIEFVKVEDNIYDLINQAFNEYRAGNEGTKRDYDIYVNSLISNLLDDTNNRKEYRNYWERLKKCEDEDNELYRELGFKR